MSVRGLVVAVFGLGEAGALIAGDLAAAGAEVRAYDPAPVETPPDVDRHDHPGTAVDRTELVLGVSAAADTATALEQAIDRIPASALYADLSTSSAGQERELAEIAASRGIAFADVALMSTVPGKGLRTPQLVSGPGGARYAELLTGADVPVTVVGPDAGEAATRKLLRSVFMKGLSAVVIETLWAAQAAGLSDWVWEHVAAEVDAADRSLLVRLIEGSGPHAVRRRHEMEAAATLLRELGVDPVVTTATVDRLRRVADQGVPQIPGRH